MAFKGTSILQRFGLQKQTNSHLTLRRLFSIAKASISLSKVNLLDILQGHIPPPFPVRSSLNGTEYPGTQNWLTGLAFPTFASGIRFIISYGVNIDLPEN